MKILIVDDDDEMREMICIVLDDFGYKHKDASSAREALEKLDGIDCVLTDWQMPEMSGIKLVQEIRKTDPLIYIIFLTAKVTKENMFEGLISGANDYLTKPIDIYELQLRLHIAEAHLALNKLKESRL